MTPEDWHILQAGKFASSRLTAYMEGMKSGKVEKKTKEELDWIWVAHYEGYQEGYLSAKGWVGLTFDDLPSEDFGDAKFLAGARWAEAMLKDKNA